MYNIVILYVLQDDVFYVKKIKIAEYVLVVIRKIS